MAKRRTSSEPLAPPPGWVISEHYTLSPNTTLEKGDQCLLKGQQGTYTFVKHVVNTKLDPPSEWVDVWGGMSGHSQHRSVKPDQLKPIPVKRSRKTRNPDS